MRAFSPLGKHCYITGGTAGLGLELAKQLVQMGAHVTVVARRRPLLDAALEQMSAIAYGGSKSEKGETVVNNLDGTQKLAAISADLSTAEGCQQALKEATAQIGVVPDYVFCCAGAATPRLFLDHPTNEFQQSFNVNYFSALYTAHEATRLMLENNVHGKIVFVGSTLSFMSFAGYASYAPAKAALRSLADALRHEFLDRIDVHMYFPGNIDSPGYVEENKVKPEITKKIEGVSDALAPAVTAKAMIAGLKSKKFQITSDFITDLARAGTIGASPASNAFLDFFKVILAYIALGVWRLTELDKYARDALRKNDPKA
ncbi:3-dehydrosphinganine reductase [Sorochytrium milnesiophthora]